MVVNSNCGTTLPLKSKFIQIKALIIKSSVVFGQLSLHKFYDGLEEKFKVFEGFLDARRPQRI